MVVVVVVGGVESLACSRGVVCAGSGEGGNLLAHTAHPIARTYAYHHATRMNT